MAPISPATHLSIKGARQHNLKDVDLVLPKNQLIVFTGLSGSGKSSMAFDTIYAEGQRRYVESLSSYARQFLGIMQKPDVDTIDGLSPSISIDQKTTSHNPRSTVGTVTEIYDYLRLLYGRIGHPHCPKCGTEIVPQTVDQITRSALDLFERTVSTGQVTRFLLLSPLIKDKKGEFSGLLDNLQKKGFARVRIDGHLYRLDEDILLLKNNRHTIEVVVDRLSLFPKRLSQTSELEVLTKRLHQSFETALDLSQGLAVLSQITDPSLSFPEKPRSFTDHSFSQQMACPQCHTSFTFLEPRLFSFNTPHGACPTCTGLGMRLKIDPAKLIAPDLTLTEGAIIPLASALSTDSWYARKAKVILKENGVSLKAQFKAIPAPIQRILLYGDSRSYTVSGTNRQGQHASFTFQPEGVVNELERRYQETQSDFIRSEIARFMTKEVCPACHGARLKPEALSVTINGHNLTQLTQLSITQFHQQLSYLHQQLHQPTSTLFTPAEKAIAAPIIKEILTRINFLLSVGLEYLTLHREAATLAGGEAQRIRLASQIGTGLTGVLYVLDEPTIGLHPRDNRRLIHTLEKLRDLGNTVLVVEHDQHVIQAADYLVDFGPQAGERGGQIVAQGTLTELLNTPASVTGRYLSGKKTIDSHALDRSARQLPLFFRPPLSPGNDPGDDQLLLSGVTHHNLQNLTVPFPLNRLTVVTGVSGSGKSSLVHDTLYPALKQSLGQRCDQPGKYSSLTGTDTVTKVLLIDQSPIGRTPRSNPATYTKAFDHIRQLFALTKSARALGYKPGRFSFNVKGGRCEACQGGGQIKIEMQFLSDVYVTCDVCQGKRYHAETLSVLYKGLNISQVLNLTVDQAVPLFKTHSALNKKLLTLQAVGLGYITLGQSAPTLSGGEAQRVKLAKELSSAASGHTVYLLDEPTTGLHFEDVKHLLVVLRSLVQQRNTVIVIEHNLDVIANADHIIDLGPEGGADGGRLVASGSPSEIAHVIHSYTGQALSQHLSFVKNQHS